MHPPFYEQTSNYELIIFRTIDSRFEIIQPRTRSTAILLIKNTIITVHDGDDTTLTELFENFKSGQHKLPVNSMIFLHLILDEIVEVFLNLREPLLTQISEWQRKLLDPNDPFDDWNIIMLAKSSLRALNSNLELQNQILSDWRENTDRSFNSAMDIKFNDLSDHMARIERLSDGLKNDLDSLTQIYFASTGQRTNINVQFLALISAVFLPLNLVAGIFGMNFEILPLIKNPYGAVFVFTFMISMSGLLLWWFKKKKWF